MIKLYVSDVDGTLVKDGSTECDPEYIRLIAKLKEQGVMFVPSSGRQYCSLHHMFLPMSDEMTFISESGSVLWKDGKPKVMGAIPPEWIQEIAEDVRRIPGADLMISGPVVSYVPQKDSEMHRWLTGGYGYDIRVVEDWVFPKENNYCKAAIYHREIDKLVGTPFYEKWSKRLHLCFAGVMWLDCILPGVSKGDTLKNLQISLGISREETVVFGDNQNDVEMMRCATRSFAVSTARDEVKREATDVIPSWNENGVLQTIRRLAKEDGLEVE